MDKKTWILILALLFCAIITTPCVAQEHLILSKKEVQFFYDMTYSDWEQYVRQLHAPEGHQLRFKEMPTGTSYVLSYPSNIHLSVQPIFNNDGVLGSLVIGSYYPKNVNLSFDEQFRKDIEKQTQQELGSQYVVKAEVLEMGSNHRGVEFMIIPAR